MGQHQIQRDPRPTAALNSQLDRKLAAYMAAATGVGLLALSPTAEAKVIYTATYKAVTPGYQLDLNHDGTMDALFDNRGECVSSEGGLFCSASSPFIGAVIGMGGGSFNAKVTALRAGAQIGPAEQFVSYGNLAAVGFRRPNYGTIESDVKWIGNFANGGHGVRDRYIGIKFSIGGETHYGWARVSVEIPNLTQPSYLIFLTGYAYETEPDTPIIAGQKTGAEEHSVAVPAPFAPNPAPAPNLGMLARGADALAIWRREEGSVTS